MGQSNCCLEANSTELRTGATSITNVLCDLCSLVLSKLIFANRQFRPSQIAAWATASASANSVASASTSGGFGSPVSINDAGNVRRHNLHEHPGEPESDAWSSGGRPNTFVTIDEYDSAECSDCQDIPREGATEKEHIAGPNCKLNKGYSGWRIGAEEMRVSAL